MWSARSGEKALPKKVTERTNFTQRKWEGGVRISRKVHKTHTVIEGSDSGKKKGEKFGINLARASKKKRGTNWREQNKVSKGGKAEKHEQKSNRGNAKKPRGRGIRPMYRSKERVVEKTTHKKKTKRWSRETGTRIRGSWKHPQYEKTPHPSL